MNLEQIAIKVKEISEKSCEGQIKLGELLIDAKSKVKHGQWKKWLDTNTNFSQSKANKLMKAYRMVKVSKSYTYTKLDIHKVFALTTLKDEIDVEIFMQNFDLENMSVREIEKEVRLYNKQLKADEMEQKKAKEVATIENVESNDTTDKVYTKIETEIKVDNVSYYSVDEVAGVMGYKIVKDFHKKYSNLIVIIKGTECIRVNDFVSILADTKENNVDKDSANVEISVRGCDESNDIYTAMYHIKSKKNRMWELIQIASCSDVFLKDGSYFFDICTVSKKIEEALKEVGALDKNTFDYVFGFIEAHLETIEEQMYKSKQRSDESERQTSDAWSKILNSKSTTINKSEYRALCKVCHPDNGGSNELMNIISKLYSK